MGMDYSYFATVPSTTEVLKRGIGGQYSHLADMANCYSKHREILRLPPLLLRVVELA
jgi:hypothetical protein